MNLTRESKKFTEALKILGVRKLATPAEIKTAWRQLAFETHPDRPTGSSEAFNRVNSAYEVLKSYKGSQRWSPTAEPQYAKQSATRRVNRPRVTTSIFEITPDLAELCRSSINECESENTIDKTSHVPQTIRRRGRAVSYIVRSALKCGTNKVSVPVDKSFRDVSHQPEIISLNAEQEGKATIEVPQKVLASKFPGASRVRIHFANA